ncbi:hydroxymethylpyrimidine/phosphomethylpyrimidine kinase [Roseobacter cerasinus]|uniref:hydroxymethylpyrimidine kinase n=1 Tax=Roseobacter cerasinus TaxID=2602289 RepID=A0A640VVH9_9RHOB|nr:hydroxymethylpyrimidine/phosphomethylpyrimidine kinase [Roseobacter cerasinus]GFE51604.1 hydroxymethylpyrimidine/phosphomethylpyrimidine kinase [Roseobacter cerasinus]
MPRLLVIAGTDCSGGAGLTRDTTVASAFGVEVAPVVTVVTAQTNAQFVDQQAVAAPVVLRQLDAAAQSGALDAVKIGALGTTETAQAVAEWLAERSIPTVMDPVLKSSSGGALIRGGLPGDLLAQVDLLTPNLPEAAALTGQALAADTDAMARQAGQMQSMGIGAVLIKGGHGLGAQSVDHLYHRGQRRAFEAPRLRVTRRGTGCTLATAIACHLIQGAALDDACGKAKLFVQDWLVHSSDQACSRATRGR